jgi:hypothetical protein
MHKFDSRSRRDWKLIDATDDGLFEELEFTSDNDGSKGPGRVTGDGVYKE